MSGIGISWAVCKSVPRSRQIATQAPHHSVFYRPDALPAAQPAASKRWRHRGTTTGSFSQIVDWNFCHFIMIVTSVVNLIWSTVIASLSHWALGFARSRITDDVLTLLWQLFLKKLIVGGAHTSHATRRQNGKTFMCLSINHACDQWSLWTWPVLEGVQA